MSEIVSKKWVSRLPVLSDYSHCWKCGQKLIRESVQTDRFDLITGEPYRMITLTCPNWELSFWGRHAHGRLATAAEEDMYQALERHGRRI